jgi:ABC-type Zn uptake system ZnuABC Zn-binding protein ZnuA
MTLRRFLSLCCGLVALAGSARAEPLRVVTSVTDLADLVHQVGGDEVRVGSLVRGPQDPHFIEARPTVVRRLHEADVYVVVGRQLEASWSPTLLQSARNPKIRPGGAGYVDASGAITPLEVPTGGVDRSQGDVHPGGNPHYLVDPVNGLRVARLLRERLSELRPEAAERFAARTAAYEQALLARLVGDTLATELGTDALLEAIDADRLDGRGDVGGWLGRLAAARGVAAVQDHRVWPYFARRFGIELLAELEPLPGIAPTTGHLTRVVALIEREHVRLLLASSYFDPRHARTVAGRTGIPVVILGHQVGALPGTDDYLSLVETNVSRVAEALGDR